MASENLLKAKELRERTDAELAQQLKDLREELFNLRFQHHVGQLENFMRITHVKRNMARLMTVVRERERLTATKV